MNNKYSAYWINTRNSFVSFKMLFSVNSQNKNIVKTIISPRSVNELFNLLKTEKICVNCGKVFIYDGQYMHINVCKKCYDINRNKKNRSKKRNQSGYDTIIVKTDK